MFQLFKHFAMQLILNTCITFIFRISVIRLATPTFYSFNHLREDGHCRPKHVATSVIFKNHYYFNFVQSFEKKYCKVLFTLNRIYPFVFLIETNRVLCEGGTEYLNTGHDFQVSISMNIS